MLVLSDTFRQAVAANGLGEQCVSSKADQKQLASRRKVLQTTTRSTDQGSTIHRIYIRPGLNMSRMKDA